MVRILDKIFDKLNLFAGLSVIATFFLTGMFFLWYAEKKLPPADGVDKQEPPKEIHPGWYAGLFCAEFFGQLMAAESLEAIESVFATVFNVAVNIVVFFVCYKVLGIVGVDKENLYERCKKAFMGLVILSLSLLILAGYAFVTQPASTQNVPAVTQEAKAEFVTTLNHENIYIYRNTLIRTDNVNEDAAPEFKCVLVDDADIKRNCEFRARGIVVMYVDGVEVGDSIDNPEIEKLYNAIVAKFL